MYPILFVFLAGLSISLERWFQLSRTRSTNQKVWDSLYPMLSKGQFEKVRQTVSKDKSTISKMLGMGLSRHSGVRRREDMEIATLLGLLGTIMGLIQAFTAVADANPAEKADLLSASISVAMNTTAFGLMSAIPLLLFHAKITSTTGQIVDSLEMASVKALNSISIAHRQKPMQNDSNLKERNDKK